MTTTSSKVFAVLIAGLVIAEAGCSRPSTHGIGQSPVPAARRDLSAEEAAQLAAQLARPYGLTKSRSGCLIPVADVGYPPKRTYPQC